MEHGIDNKLSFNLNDNSIQKWNIWISCSFNRVNELLTFYISFIDFDSSEDFLDNLFNELNNNYDTKVNKSVMI